jgi:hypothetical protein
MPTFCPHRPKAPPSTLHPQPMPTLCPHRPKAPPSTPHPHPMPRLRLHRQVPPLPVTVTDLHPRLYHDPPTSPRFTLHPMATPTTPDCITWWKHSRWPFATSMETWLIPRGRIKLPVERTDSLLDGTKELIRNKLVPARKPKLQQMEALNEKLLPGELITTYTNRLFNGVNHTWVEQLREAGSVEFLGRALIFNCTPPYNLNATAVMLLNQNLLKLPL